MSDELSVAEKVKRGVDILLPYTGDKYADFWADREVVGVNVNYKVLGDETPETVVSEHDRERLEELGWFYSTEFDSWARFV